jgi:hypothetical protein
MESGYTMCWAAKWDGDGEMFNSSIHYDGEAHMLGYMHGLLCEADAVVHYNGKKFDMPTLNKEFIKAGMSPPDPYDQIDLLQVARKRFRFASNKLDHVANELGLGQKVKHIGHELWVQCMNGVDEAWQTMIEYNKNDVVLLEKLYHVMLPWINNHPNHALHMDSDRPVCPNCGSTHVVKKGYETTNLMKYQRYRCADCQTPLRGRKTLLKLEEREHVLTQSKK